MITFACTTCQTIFYSLSSEKAAKCPNCGSECSELGQKSTASQKVDFDSYVDRLRRSDGGCNSGGGCCG